MAAVPGWTISVPPRGPSSASVLRPRHTAIIRLLATEQSEDVAQAIRARLVRCLSSPSPERRDGMVGGAGVRKVQTG